MLDMPKAILFDLGDTVLEEVGYDITVGFGRVSRHFLSQATLEGLSQATEKYQTGTSEFMLLRWIEKNLEKSNSGVKAEDVELELWKNTVSLVPADDVRLALDFLTERGIRLAAVSNAIFSSKCIKYELNKHGLLRYFEFVRSSADLGIRKPDIRVFESALLSLGLTSKEVWFIGDKWDADIIGASAMQLTPVWFRKQFPEHDKDVKHLKLRRWRDFEELWLQHGA